LAAQIIQRQDLGYRLLGYVDSDLGFAGQDIEALRGWNNRRFAEIMANEVIERK